MEIDGLPEGIVERYRLFGSAVDWIGLDDVAWWAVRLLEARPCKWTCVLLLVGGGHGVLAGRHRGLLGWEADGRVEGRDELREIKKWWI